MRPLILLLLFLGLLTGCEAPTAEFDAFVLPRPVNMVRVLGPAPVLLGPQDTLALHLRFNATTSFTDFNLADDSTTQSWFTARAFRFRGLYYLVEERPDARYWVHAVHIRHGQVQGLGTGYQQMRALSEAVWQGHWPQLLAPDGDTMRLRFDRQQLRKFYSTEPDRFATYQLVAAPASQQATPVVKRADTQSVSLYLNPASSTATVAFGDTAAHQVQLYDERGQLVRTYLVSAPQLILPVADLPNGPYIIRVHTSDPATSTTLRLLVAH